LGPGPGNLSQNGLKPTPLITSLTKNPNARTKNFFSLQTQRLAKSFEEFEHLSSTFAWQVMQLLRHARSQDFIRTTGSKDVKLAMCFY